MNRRLNVRVYGLCLDPAKGLLVADERIHGRSITKLPGGGLEFGEGTLDCLKREFIEETGQPIEIIRHFYTTDFFVPSAFNPESQIISIYYEVAFLSPPEFEIKEKKFDFEPGTHDTFVFRWVRLSDLSPEEFTFPIDKRVAEILIG